MGHKKTINTNPPPSTAKHIILLVLVIIFLLFACEIMVRVGVPETIYLPYSNIFRAVATDAVYTYKPDLRTTAFGVELATNSLGFRGPEWVTEKQQNTFRIALIGDSHAFGYGVKFQDTVGEKLTNFLKDKSTKDIEVLNFGVNGYNSKQQLYVLENYALRFNPNLVILLPCGNDHEPHLIADEQGYLRTQSLSPVNDTSINTITASTISKIAPYSRLALYLVFLKNRFELHNTMPHPRPNAERPLNNGKQWWMAPFTDGPFPKYLIKSVYEPIKMMIKKVKFRNTPVIIANYNAKLGYRRLFKKLSIEEDIPSFELLTLFPEALTWEDLKSQFSLGWNDHLNAEAHKRWALALTDIILSNGYMDMTEKKGQQNN